MPLIPSKVTERPELMSFPIVVRTYISFLVLFILGYIQQAATFFRALRSAGTKAQGYAPLTTGFDRFFHDNMYNRFTGCFNNAIASAPSNWITVMDRQRRNHRSAWELTGTTTRALNFGSYNYLGFAAAKNNGAIEGTVLDTLDDLTATMSAGGVQFGTSSLHRSLDVEVAQFVQKEAAVCFAMGFATNAAVIPALVTGESLIISDALNHASIVVGSRSVCAKKAVFRHDDMAHLERTVRDAIVEGTPTGNHWDRILIVVEGIYSMEGTICNLPEIVRIARQYHCLLYVDEAHSIGALGPHGQGVCDYFNDRFALFGHADRLLSEHPAAEVWGNPLLWKGTTFSPRHYDLDTLRAEHEAGAPTRAALERLVGPVDFFDEVDLMMGTFTKSFSAVGGYVAGSAPVIARIRRLAYATAVAEPLSPACVRQILGVLHTLSAPPSVDGTGQRLIRQLSHNTRLFRKELRRRGFHTMGQDDSPVVPLLIYNPIKMGAFHRMALDRGIAIVVVAYPACSLIASRVRFCLSAGHTPEDLAWAIEHIDELGDILDLKYG